jgi:class 3 adenylate cyclase
MTDLPAAGVVTYLFTDVEGSSALWERHPKVMRRALARHDYLVDAHVQEHGGALVRSRGEGDSFFAVFGRPLNAVLAAVALQRALFGEAWPVETPLRIRIALHTGDSELREETYYGEAVNRCARLRATAHGGQIVVSEATARLVRNDLPPDISLWALGEHRLRHLTRPERIFQVLAPGLPSEFPRLHTIDAEVGSFRPGGERRELTVLFSDLRGFTAVAESLDPDQVFLMLNEYLTTMEDAIYDFQGTIDKFMADGIIAFWGAPVQQPDHAGQACRAALRMVEELGCLNERWTRAGRPAVTISIGIHTGKMLVGNLGSVSRFDYSVIGEAVNLGARLEELTRRYDVQMIVSDATLQRTGGLRARFLDALPPDAGGSELEIFELLGKDQSGEHLEA